MNGKVIKWIVGVLIGAALVLVGELYDRPVLTALGAPLLAVAGVGAGRAHEVAKQ